MNDAGSEDLEERVLALAPTAKDAEATRQILTAAGLQCFLCKTMDQVCHELTRGGGAALLTQEAILSDKQGCLAEVLRQQPPWSDFPLLVLTPAGTGSPKTNQALEAIGHMTLMKRPIAIAELVSTIRSSLRDRRRQYGMRDLLAERDRQAAALVESREQLAFALEAGALGSWQWDLTTGEFECSAICKMNFGLPPDAALSHERMLELIHPLDRPEVENAITRSLAGHTDYDVEYRNVWPDGSVHWVMVRGRAAYDARGNPVRMAGVSLQITGRKEAETRLRESEERFRTLAVAAPGVVWSNLPDGTVDYVNQRWFDLTGQTPEQVYSAQGWAKALHPRDRERLSRTFLDSVKAGVPFEVEARFRTAADRAYRWHLNRAVPLKDSRGNVVKYFGTCTDIDDKKLAEQAIHKLNDKLSLHVQELQTLFDTAPVGINVAADPNCRVIVSNHALAEMFGRPFGEDVSKTRADADRLPYTILKQGVEVPPERLPMQRAAAEGISIEGEIYEVVRADGSMIQVLVNAKPVRDDAGVIQGAVGVYVDITALRKAEDALRQADKRKDEFLAMLAHELRNPLAAVNNAVTVLKISDAEENRAWASDVVERQVKQLTRLIDDLLDVSRITSGKIRLRREAMDAAPVLDQAIESVKPLLDERKHRLSVSIDRGNLPLKADPTRLEQIVLNLLTNAAKYTESGGQIALTAQHVDDHIVITVSDNGMGIPPEKLPEMFQLFAQGERSIARSEGGLGIGLTIVQKLTEMHGGSVTATSNGPGEGSEFTVLFPALRKTTPVATAPEAAPTEKSKASRILVVDDNLDTASGMFRLLKLLGNEVQLAHDGSTAVAICGEFRPDFVLLDIGLPGMDGYQVAAKLKTDQGCKSAVIIGISGYGQEEDRRRSRAAGFDHHLVKPINFDTLVALLGHET